MQVRGLPPGGGGTQPGIRTYAGKRPATRGGGTQPWISGPWFDVGWTPCPKWDLDCSTVLDSKMLKKTLPILEPFSTALLNRGKDRITVRSCPRALLSRNCAQLR